MLKEQAKKWIWGAGFLALEAGRLAMAQGIGTNPPPTGSGGSSAPITLPNPISANTLQDVVAQISNFLFIIAVPLTAIMALVGGFQMITAGGNPEKFTSGRKTLMYAAIGFAVVILAGGVAYIVQDLFKKS